MRLRNPVLAAAVGAGCISSSAVVVKLAGAPAGTTAFYRCALALPGLIVLATLEQRRQGGRSLHRRLAAVLAGGWLGVDIVLWTSAIYDLGAGVATVLGNLQVLFVAIIAWGLWRERPPPRLLLVLPIVLGGVVLAAGLGGPVHRSYHPVAGLLFGLGTAATYAAFILILRRSTTGSRHVAGPLADATVGAALAALALGRLLGQMSFGLNGTAFLWLVVLALTSQTFGWLLITSSLPQLRAAVSSLLLLLQPAGSLLLAAVVLGQRPSVLQLVGAALVCGGVVAAAGRERSAVEVREPGPV
jgi:drug/metabolite transporter (DMT)-like permease